jgi:hypothetical protein
MLSGSVYLRAATTAASISVREAGQPTVIIPKTENRCEGDTLDCTEYVRRVVRSGLGVVLIVMVIFRPLSTFFESVDLHTGVERHCQ